MPLQRDHHNEDPQSERHQHPDEEEAGRHIVRSATSSARYGVTSVFFPLIARPNRGNPLDRTSVQPSRYRTIRIGLRQRWSGVNSEIIGDLFRRSPQVIWPAEHKDLSEFRIAG